MKKQKVEHIVKGISLGKILSIGVLAIIIATFSFFYLTVPYEVRLTDKIQISLFQLFIPLFWFLIYSITYIFPVWLIFVGILFIKFFKKIIPHINYLHGIMSSAKLINRSNFTSIVILYNIPILFIIGLSIEVNIGSMLLGIGTWWILIFLFVSLFRKIDPVFQKGIIIGLILKPVLSIVSLLLLDILINNGIYDFLIEPIADNLYGQDWAFIRGGNEDFIPMFLGVFGNGVFIFAFSLFCAILIKNIGFLRKQFLNI